MPVASRTPDASSLCDLRLVVSAGGAHDGIIVEVTEVVGVEGSRVLVERYLPLHDTVLKLWPISQYMNRARQSSLKMENGHTMHSDSMP